MTKPIIVIIVLVGVFSYLGYNARHFRIDASADSLILENDKDFKYYRKISKTYGSHSYMFITYKPDGGIFAPETLAKLASLRDKLKEIKRVSSVLTLLDVPLLRNPPVPIKELISNIKSLESPNVDLQLAREEIANSPIYQELLVSTDMKMTALMVHFAEDDEYDRILSRRGGLRQKLATNTITPAEHSELEALNREYRACKIRMDKERHSDIASVRRIMDGYREDAELFLGGISMITDDLITFVKNDLEVFGIGIIIFLIVALGIIFRKICWIVLPVLCCTLSVLAMIGILGIFGWEVTVISSNFISLQLIITMALTIHLIVRFRELQVDNPEWSQMELVKETVFSKFIPCLYTTLTTVAGFGSLLICDILPVINFGLMMSVGLVVSLVVTFFLFPAILCLLPKGKTREDRQFCGGFTRFLANVTQNYAKTVFIVTGLLVVMIVAGVSRLTVENSFIDYFRESTEIYQGLKVIDQNLGGTTPLDILVNFNETDQQTDQNANDISFANSDVIAEPGKEPGEVDELDEFEGNDGFGEFDEFDELYEEDNSDKYWFTSDKMAKIMKVHDYLDSLPEIGKVLSLGTMLKVAEQFTKGEPLDDFQLALLYTQLPDNFKDMALTPYISIPDNQARLTVRIKDSLKGLKRDNLLKKITSDMENKLGLQKRQYHLAGMMVLYNNMLQSLFSSQILTIGFVVLALMVMFTLLFRSIKIALIAIIPNIISAIAVLGVMGLAGLPLDFITITIAAISIGIAVDDTIHYIHRFKEEYQVDRDYMNSMHRCHGSIGNAMYYTSLTIIAGFSILVLSYFIPTILFGLLTSLAMFIALITALTLLPRLIIAFKPFGK
ncbi:integral membrane protein [Candidatus Scalindua japonica]|uniref:Integral membrane protein n=1 Tax=Candidatus Scalindua japonica TaxID=1284222 RepID=A0A286TX91_9BACT|nr:MMPL family transporter [Candidatus Scalindua japonica]GAX60496.1 integral membrane protein [Candidatus Scalindua japonica]